MPDPPPLYLVALCEGRACVPLTRLDDAPLTTADAVAVLARLARRLRDEGAVGLAVLVDGRTKRVVATRRVWP